MTTKVEQLLTGNQRADYESLQLHVPIFLRSPRALMSALLIFTDLFSFMLAGLLANGLGALFGGNISVALFLEIVPFILLSQVVFALRHLYPAIGMSPVNELRRLTGSTTAVFLLLAAMTFWLRNPESYSRTTLALTWAFGLLLVPLGRALMRETGGRIGFYGEPIVVIGYGERGKEMVTFLLENLAIGLHPVMIIDGCDDSEGRSIDGVQHRKDTLPEMDVYPLVAEFLRNQASDGQHYTERMLRDLHSMLFLLSLLFQKRLQRGLLQQGL